jgi:hypothetical protein
MPTTPTLKGTTNNAAISSGTSATVSSTGSVQAGNLMVVVMLVGGASQPTAFTAPDGTWTTFMATIATASGGTIAAAIFYKRATATGAFSGSFGWTTTATSGHWLFMEWTGQGASLVDGAVADTQNASGTKTSPSVNPGTGLVNDTLVCLTLGGVVGTDTLTQPGGMTSILLVAGTSAIPFFGCASLALASASATGTKTWTIPTSRTNLGVSFLIQQGITTSWEVGELPPPMKRLQSLHPLPSNDAAAPVTTAPSEFLPNFVSQWFQQSPLTISGSSVYYPTAMGLGPPPVIVPPPLGGWQFAQTDARLIKAPGPGRLNDDGFAPQAPATTPAPNFVAAVDAIRRLPGLRILSDIVLPTPQFPPPFVGAWVETEDQPERLPALRRLDDVQNPIGVPAGEFLPSFVAQWHHQWEIPRLPPPRRLDVNLTVLAPALGEFLQSYISQWLGQSDIGRLRGPQVPDNPGVIPPAAGEFLANVISQWLGQSDIRHLAGPRPLDEPARPAFTFPTAPIPSFISQWYIQGDIRRLLSPRAPDNLGVIPPAPGEFTPSFISQWVGQSDIRRLRPPGLLDNLTAPLNVPVAVVSLVSAWMAADLGRVLRAPRRLDDALAPFAQFFQALEPAFWPADDVARRRPRIVPLDNLAALAPVLAALEPFLQVDDLARLRARLHLPDDLAAAFNIVLAKTPTDFAWQSLDLPRRLALPRLLDAPVTALSFHQYAPVVYAETVVQFLSSKTATTQAGADVAIRPASSITAVE